MSNHMQGRKNHMRTKEFLIFHILGIIAGCSWYGKLFPGGNDDHYDHIKVLMLCVVVICAAVGFGATRRNRRNCSSVSYSLAIGFGIYTMFIQYRVHKALILAMLAIEIILTAAYIFMIVSKEGEKTKTSVRRKRAEDIIYGTYKLCGVCMMLMLILLWGNSVMNSDRSVGDVLTVDHYDDMEQILNEKLGTISLLADERWDRMSDQEKLSVLQTVADLEQVYLGLPHTLTVGMEELEEGEWGCYEDKTHKIIINSERVANGSSWNVLLITLHEAYHALEHRCSEAYMALDEESRHLMPYRDAAAYVWELSHYIDADEDSDRYYMQKCEQHARRYGEIRREEYYEIISVYLENDKGCR